MGAPKAARGLAFPLLPINQLQPLITPITRRTHLRHLEARVGISALIVAFVVGAPRVARIVGDP